MLYRQLVDNSVRNSLRSGTGRMVDSAVRKPAAGQLTDEKAIPIRRTALRQKNDNMHRHAEEDRGPVAVRRLVQSGRRIRNVRVHRQLRPMR